MDNNLVFLPEDKEITAAEIWLPSRNETEAEAVCQFISSLPENISLEYLARGSKRSMLVRGSMRDVKTVGALIAAAYPAASLHILEDDPIRELETKDNIVSGDYGFSGEGYLPLKHFERYKGERIKVRLIRPVNSQRDFSGILEDCDKSRFTLRLEDGSAMDLDKKETSYIKLDDFE